MNILVWFGVGLAIMAALWWWRFLVKWLTYDDGDDIDPFHLVVERRPRSQPDYVTGFFAGTFAFLCSPAWIPIYFGAVASIWTYNHLKGRSPGVFQRSYKAMLGEKT